MIDFVVPPSPALKFLLLDAGAKCAFSGLTFSLATWLKGLPAALGRLQSPLSYLCMIRHTE
uniref:Uncharacterized protein n=1 Tax=Nymphaea colorata TaxID=210225 RepID=A0A5K0XFG5_9MAGN